MTGLNRPRRRSERGLWRLKAGSPVVGLLCLSLVAGGLAFSLDSIAAPGAATAAAAPSDDDAEVTANPLPSLAEPADEADAVNPLPRAQADMPDSGGATVDGDDTWTDVPGIPVEIRADDAAGGSESPSPSEPPTDEPTEPSSPSESPTNAPSPPDGSASDAAFSAAAVDDPSDSPSESADPTTTDSPSASNDPTDSPSATETPGPSDTASPSPTDPPADDASSEIAVNLLQPKSLVSSAFIITVDEGQATGEDDESEASEEPSASASPAAWRIAAESSDEASPSEGADDDSDSPDPGTAPISGVDVRLSYADFVQSYGGAWSDRLAIVAYPACFVDTPTDPACSEGVRLDAMNNPTTQTLRFTSINETELAEALAAQDADSGAPADGDSDNEPDPSGTPSASPSNAVNLTAAGRSATRATLARSSYATTAAVSTSSGVVYAATSTAAQFGATPLSPSAGWQVVDGSGEFSYSYPFTLPQAQGGETPKLSLDYSSGSVDGMSRVQNGQASMAGIGWTLSNAYITRSYASCADDGLPDKGDLCWKTRNGHVVNKLQIVIDGIATPLVRIGDTNNFRMADDRGWNVDFFQGDSSPAANDDNNHEAFKVTTTDGTVYWFGRGYGTSSVLTVPVFGDDDGEPCYDPSATSKSWCQQAWWWGLDRVEDVNNNVVRYTYAKETNYYSRFGNTALSNRTPYDRAGYLTTIEYGYDRNADGLARQVVDIALIARCTKKLTNVDADCTGDSSPTQNPSIWPDVPVDLICQDTGDCLNGSPSFFSTKRYYQVKTSTVSGRGSSQVKRLVDTYTLGHTMPDPDGAGTDGPDLWLDSITRTGTGADGSKSLPPVNFNGDAFANRVDPPEHGRNLAKFRITNLRNEMGGRINVVYGHADGHECTPNYVNNGDDGQPRARFGSTKECYPQKYDPPGEPSPHWEWFNKYVVTRIALGDDALGYRLNNVDPDNSTVLGSLRVYDYDYRGDPAWRYDDDANLPDDQETWDDWRGYGTVLIHTRSTNGKKVIDGDRSVRKVTVYRGMNNTRKNGSPDSNQQVQLDVTEPGQKPDDIQWLAGKVAEESLIGPGGGWLNRTYHAYDSYLTVEADEGALEHRAHFSYESAKKTYTNLNNGTDVTTHEIDTTVDPGGDNHRGVKLGAVSAVFDRGDPTTSGDPASCVTTDWATNSDTWLRVPSVVTTHDGNCSATDVSKTRNLYDAQPDDSSAPITKGQLKSVCTYTDLTSGSTTCSESRYNYDYYGRTTATRTPNGTWTKIDYDSDNGVDGLITKVTTTDNSSGSAANQFATVTTLDPRRSQPTRVLDANNRGTSVGYDPLGRIIDVTYPGNSVADARSVIYKYTDSTTAPSRVWAQTLRSSGTVYDSSYTFYDGWGRTIESQSAQPDAPDNGRIVSVTGYDDQGLARYSMPAVPSGNTTTPYDTVLNPAPADVWRYNVTDFDAAGRTTKFTRMTKSDVVSATTTSYGAADGRLRVAVDPQDAGTTTTQYDVWDRPVQITQYNSDDTTTTPADRAKYTYDSRGNLVGMSKTIASAAVGGDTTLNWSYGYDAANRRKSAVDPELGTTSYGYDANGNVTDTTTPTNHVTTTYDFFDRPTSRTSDDSSVSYSWAYDASTVANSRGRLTSTTAKTPLGVFTTAVSGYDPKGQPTGTDYTLPNFYAASGVSNPLSVSYDRNDGGQVVSTTYPAVGSTAAGALKSATIDAEFKDHGAFSSMFRHSSTGFKIADVTHNSRGQIITEDSTTGSTGTSQSFSRNFTYSLATDNLSSLWAGVDGGGSLFQQSYIYDRQDQPTHIDEMGTTPGPNGGAPISSGYCYSYDNLGRLKTAQRSLGTATERDNCTKFTDPAAYNLAYSYKNDRLSTVTKTPASGSAITNTYKYDNAVKPHQATSVSGTASLTSGLPEPGDLQYDDAGRVKQWVHGGITDQQYYDGFGNLKELHRTEANGNRTLVRYVYDSDGNRLARESSPATSTWVQTGTVTTVFYLGDGMELTWSKAVSGGTPIVAARRTYSTPDGHVMAIEQGVPNANPDFTWVATDRLQAVRLARTVGSAATKSYLYLPYGDPALQVGSTTNSTATGERAYLNKPQDPNGDIRLDHRSYDPSIGILTTPDPILDTSDPQSLNPYAYSRNNPITFTDPTGLNQADPTNGGGAHDNPDPTPEEEAAAWEDLYQAQDPDSADTLIENEQEYADDPEKLNMLRSTWLNLQLHEPETSCGDVMWCSVLTSPVTQEIVVGSIIPVERIAAVTAKLVRLRRAAIAAETAADGAAAARAARTFGPFGADDIRAAAAAADRNGLTRVGRSLQKHSGRSISAFKGLSTGSAVARNEQGMQVLEEIIGDPRTTTEVLDNVINVWDSTGRGFRLGSGGNFMGFLEPTP